jgi:hypothetical protein
MQSSRGRWLPWHGVGLPSAVTTAPRGRRKIRKPGFRASWAAQRRCYNAEATGNGCARACGSDIMVRSFFVGFVMLLTSAPTRI